LAFFQLATANRSTANYKRPFSNIPSVLHTVELNLARRFVSAGDRDLK
jgi:hypothetical protein